MPKLPTVLAQYLFKMTDHNPTDWQLKGVAIAGYTVALLGTFHFAQRKARLIERHIRLTQFPVVVLHNKLAYHLANGIAFVKIATLIFISITGFVVLGGHTRVQDPTANFHNSFEGKATAYGITNGLYKIIFSYAGYENAFNVVNEVKVSLRRNRPSTERSDRLTLYTRTLSSRSDGKATLPFGLSAFCTYLPLSPIMPPVSETITLSKVQPD
jgi:amino acid transporter